MKRNTLSSCRAACALAALSLIVPAYAAPPAGDIWGAWLKERLSLESYTDVLRSDHQYTDQFLFDRSNPYSAFRMGIFPRDPTAFNALVFDVAAIDAGQGGHYAEAAHMLAWDLGLTKARAGHEVPQGLTPIDGSARAAANLHKAGVAPEHFYAVQRLFQNRDPAIAASYMLALQLFKDKREAFNRLLSNTIAVPQWVGLEKRVWRRFMTATDASPPTRYDFYYLRTVLQGDLTRWQAGGVNMHGSRELPLPYRLARAAAALRDHQGYPPGRDPCTVDGSGKRLVFHDAHTLCFIDASDRATFEWFVDDFMKSVARADGTLAQSTLRDDMVEEMARLRPMWLGHFDVSLLAAAPRAEIVEAILAPPAVVTQVHEDDPLSVRYEPDRFQHRAFHALNSMVSP